MDHANILAKVINQAKKQEPIRALILEGSKAGKGKIDELSDYDINMFITDPRLYEEDDRWIREIDDVWVYIPEKIYHKNKTFSSRLIIFKGGINVDFILYSTGVLHEFAKANPLPPQYDIGYKVLIDKDKVTTGMAPPTYHGFKSGKSTVEEFQSCVRVFWFESYHTAKYLKRRDLWTAKYRFGTTHLKLMKMIQWYERGKHNWNYTTHPVGKYMKSWVEPGIWESLHKCFSGFKAKESWDAMFQTFNLFSKISRETAKLLGCEYPVEIEESVVGFCRGLRGD